jgi:FAD synthase
MKSRIDYNRPTAMMLGRWQPWHKGHQELFKKALRENRSSHHYDKKYA